MAGLPGVKVGPLDPDATESFGQVSATHNARRLIRLHSLAHPPELVRALARKLDEPRTTAVLKNMPEVREYLAGLKLENGDPVVPKGAVVEGASVRGEPETDQVLTFTFRTKSGRSGKWYTPYDGDALPAAHELGDELVRVARAKELGVVAWDSEGHSTEILRRELSRARRREDALRAQIEGRGQPDASDQPEPEGDAPTLDVRSDNVITDDNERLRVENQELRGELGRIRQLLEALPGGQQALLAQAQGQRVQSDAASEAEPYDGYEGETASDVAKRLKDEGTPAEEVQAVLDYERAHANRATVVKAAEQRLDQNRE